MPKFYTLSKEQVINCTLDEAWAFFSSPRNLKEIAPDYLGFEITTPDLAAKTILIDEKSKDNSAKTYDQKRSQLILSRPLDKMYQGQIISYRVSPLLGIKMNWMTEINHVEHKKYFVDNQRFGPYTMWHHQHWFEEVPNGVKMKDIITYVMPFGPLGRLAHWLFVRKKLEGIFEYRTVVTDRLFGEMK